MGCHLQLFFRGWLNCLSCCRGSIVIYWIRIDRELKKKKERQNRENYHGELCLNKSHEGKEPKTIWLQIWEISNWYFFAINCPFWSRRASENLWGQQFRVSKYLWQDFSVSLLFLVQMRLPLVAALEFSFPCYRLINWKYTVIFCLKRSAVLCN